MATRLHRTSARGATEQAGGNEAPSRTSEDTAMGNFIGFAEVAGAVIGAFGLALALEWVSLYGLTSLVPGRRNGPTNGAKSDI